ncbi:AzlC family ABC transporter permease [Acerihabitans arboris]|uniref:Branched-chain amino acid ABC transporter permease n=1 Tax=Acerihabitans arboris TaxID=2691583 RepID=A0A845SM97_9GAMM|nr:AzlC family ABC transporter permease [Acerihabitans arboris]NDL66040.1 branched-chain amino acid ABC transporter permease [Acerihabitans arboris]
MKLQSIGKGLREASPIMIGYLPVAMAFGAAAQTVGLTFFQAMAISTLIFAGASQFLLLSTLASGASLFIVVIICTAINLRHLLYGPMLMDILPKSAGFRRLYSFYLTDEVFATLRGSRDQGEKDNDSCRLITVFVCAWGTWLIGTAIGCLTGNIMSTHAPELAEAAGFALPALFLTLCWLNKVQRVLPAMTVAGITAGVLTYNGHASLGIFAGIIIGFLVLKLSKGVRYAFFRR